MAGKEMEKGSKGSIAVLVLRMVLGIIFLSHGLQKVFGVFGGSGITPTVDMLDKAGFMYPFFWAWVFAVVETVSGLFLTLGIMPRLSSGLIALLVLFVIIKIHGPNGFFASKGGYEYDLLVLAVCVNFMASGGGKYSFFDKM